MGKDVRTCHRIRNGTLKISLDELALLKKIVENPEITQVQLAEEIGKVGISMADKSNANITHTSEIGAVIDKAMGEIDADFGPYHSDTFTNGLHPT